MKKISIMLTSYNLEDYIDTSIGSVVQQDMPCDWELLIGDDGSTDGTVDRINKWIDKFPNNIKLYTIPRNNETKKIGSRAAKNRAYLLERASGDYLHYLDGDDCWLGTEKLKKQFELLESPEYANCSCCAHNSDVYVIPENRKYLLTNKNINNKVFNFKEYWKYHYFHTNTLLFRKECKAKLLHPDYRDFLNDNFITFLVIQFGDILYLNDVWAQYNMTGDGLWTGHKKIYGLFRNLQIIDLQIRERPDCRNLVYYRHYNDLNSILHEYNYSTDYQTISPLLESLDSNNFQLLFLLANYKNSSSINTRQLKDLRRKLNFVFFQKIFNKIINKIVHLFR